MLKEAYRFLERNAPSPVKKLFPRSWRIWLGYQVKIAWQPTHQPAKVFEQSVTYQPQPGQIQSPAPELKLPDGESERSIRQFLAQYYVKEEGLTTERKGYLNSAFARFLYTFQIIPNQPGKLLEIGASPYYISLLLKRFRSYDLTLVNYFGEGFRKGSQLLVDAGGAVTPMEYDNYNLETEELPYEAGTFDVVLLCEVFEHLTNDPYRAILEMKRLLKPNGSLVLTTPNVVRMDNVVLALVGVNPFDQYSAYGPYGRHNREYTVAEMRTLLVHGGFTIEQAFTADSHPAPEYPAPLMATLDEVRQNRPYELGQYMFIRAKNTSAANPKKPHWLYRSYAAEQTDSA